MKRSITMLLTLAMVFTLWAQEEDTTNISLGKKNIVTVTESDEGTNLNVKDDFVVVDETNDTIKVKLGNKGISITEEGNEINVERNRLKPPILTTFDMNMRQANYDLVRHAHTVST